ncbi:L-rhamnose/proton symporter RhaT [Pontiella sulfatireligans]|uniref:L-rhamnose-proton symporter n=1 Tax=Pontiella sulfatireligans TaxID=2750658 RepID=A0A6C2UWI8_9BACT|nr:L-rhamnose/proton symporter RhaT [Pontiella sulfatireligans]VGO23477.1 L-rhamnose-proton symporter [Pontiella sulfatireligans]
MEMIGVLWALLAGVMLGLYALPEKYTKDFKYENTWGLFFILTMFVVPVIASIVLLGGFDVFGMVDSSIIWKMAVASVLWGTGVMMWGKAINHIGLSLGFSLFIGTVILVGSVIPFFVAGLPATNVFGTIMAGLVVVLAGVVMNGKAGLAREQDEKDAGKERDESKGSMLKGIIIAVVGGLLATGFSFANAVGAGPLGEAVSELGLDAWKTAVAVMFPIFISGGIVMGLYFIQQLSQKKLWGDFNTPRLIPNFFLIFIMAFFHYAASAMFAFAASKLGASGNTVGYAIFNASCVITAIMSGIVVGEWKSASSKAKGFLYAGLACMVVGIVIIAVGNGLG